MDEPLAMRRADFWTALVFFAIALGMIASAMTMPLRESFAGVQNAWYVSPALLPLIIAGGLLILATTLMVNAVRTGGAAAALATLRQRSASGEGAGERMLAAILIVAGYVYGFIPRVDYLVATALFLQVFIAAFYLARRDVLRQQTGVFLAFALPAILADLLGQYPGPATPGRYALDGVALLVFVGLWLITWHRVGRDVVLRRRLTATVLVSVVVSLLTGVAFKFGLLVPLPAEGAVVRVLEAIELALRPLWA
jgi:hypothetical protein